MNIDGISSLPSDARAKILSFLTLKEAVMTSPLSSAWKDGWATMPDVSMDDSDFASSDELLSFMRNFLLLRTAPVRKFTMCAAAAQPRISRALDVWLLSFSKKKMEEATLIIRGPVKYHLPTSFFSCAFLKVFHGRALQVELPLSFKGFELLTTLTLDACFATETDLERLILGCPMLEVLLLRRFEGIIANLNLCAPNLQVLGIMGEFRKLNLQSPHLHDLSVHLGPGTDPPFLLEMTMQQGSSNFNGAFGQCLHSIARLELDRFSMLNFGFQYLQDNPPGSFDNLKVLRLETCATCPVETAAVLYLFQNAQNIQILRIQFCNDLLVPSLLDLEACSFVECTFPHLRILKIKAFHGLKFAVLKHLLLNSPSLEKVFIQKCDGKDSLEESPDLLTTVLQFRGASSKAEIFVL